MKETLSVRAPRCITKRAIASGCFVGDSLADVQPRKSSRREDYFKYRPTTKHEHSWISGDVSWVCVLCGTTRPKS